MLSCHVRRIQLLLCVPQLLLLLLLVLVALLFLLLLLLLVVVGGGGSGGAHWKLLKAWAAACWKRPTASCACCRGLLGCKSMAAF
jgi:hypothetical protein